MGEFVGELEVAYEESGCAVHLVDGWWQLGVCAMCGELVSWVDGVAVGHTRVDVLGKLERGDYG